MAERSLRERWSAFSKHLHEAILGDDTEPAQKTTNPEEVADAWIDQENGHERYFFKNVQCGIRTPHDLLIWKRIEEKEPDWLRNNDYKNAIDILRREMSSTS